MKFFRTQRQRARDLVQEARAALEAGNLPRGEALLSQALELAPDHADALFELAGVRFFQGRADAAIELISRCIAAEPGRPHAHEHRGRVRHQQGDHAGALQDFDAELRLRPGDVDTLLSRGSALGAMGKQAEARASYEEAMRHAPGDARPYFNRALLLGDSDADAAIADFSAAIQREARNPLAFFGRGFHRRARGELREALQDLQQAVRLGRFDNDHVAVEWIRELHGELARAGGPPVQGLHAGTAWVGRETRLSESLHPLDGGLSPDTGSGPEFATVPAGYKVVVLHPDSRACFARAESGVWVAQLGDGDAAPGVVARAGVLANRGEPAYVVWVVQPGVLGSADFDEFFALFAAVVLQSRGTVDHSAVLPGLREAHRPRAMRLAGLGIDIRHAASNGACFLEVHGPDGIVISFPGAALERA